VVAVEDMPFLEDGTPVDVILNPLGVPGRMNIGQVLETHLGWAALRMGYRAVVPVFDSANEREVEAELARAWMIDKAWDEVAEKAWQVLIEQDPDYDAELYEDENEVRNLYLEQWLGSRGYDVYQIVSDRTFARNATAREWLNDKGYVADDILAPPEEYLRGDERDRRNDNAIETSYRIWLELYAPELKDVDAEKLNDTVHEVMFKNGRPIPTLGKQIMRDGIRGQQYDTPVTVGVMTMLKLHHLVEDKVHARATGPYSLVTQQPLGGKAQFGGQRFGEMEVWALEAYGASYTLQEMLTVKSDDVVGRVKTYESIVKDEPIEEPGIPASFNVLVKELQSLGLSVEAITDDGEIKFGKEESRRRMPNANTGLLGLGDSLMK
jgi:DNA-directed RNA polymerase subunit beta